MLEVQNLFLKNSLEVAKKTLEELGVNYKEETSPSGDVFVHLDYDMIRGVRTSEIVKECRGIVLRKADWGVVRFGFRRFMNFGETGQDQIDYSKPTEYEEKLDGSLIFLHYLEDTWNVGTRGCVFPTAKINDWDVTFPQLFWSLFKVDTETLNPNICYLFELCSLTNLVVIRHVQPKVVLIGGRYCSTWAELTSEELNDEAQRVGLLQPGVFTFSGVEDILAHVGQMNKNSPGIEHEGIVVKQWDSEGSYLRIKVKSEAYVALHNIISARSLGNMVRFVLNDEKNILEGLDEYLTVYDKIEAKVKQLEVDSEVAYKTALSLIEGSLDRESRKVFAQYACKTPHSGYCFARLDQKVTNFQEWKETLKNKAFYQEPDQEVEN